jgi:putative sterol carrier protein
MSHTVESQGPVGFKSNEVFAKMAGNLKANPALLKTVNGTFLFHVTGGPEKAKVAWVVDAKAGANAVGSVSVANDPAGAKADCEITISDADLLALATGKLNAMSAYMSGKLNAMSLSARRAYSLLNAMSGKLKVKGKSTLAQKLGELLKKAPEPKSKL